MWFGALALMMVSSCSQTPESADRNAEFEVLRDAFLEGFFEHHPAMAAGLGRHEFDGRLPDWSREGIARTAAFYHEYADKARAIEPEALDEPHRFEREYLLAVIDEELFWLETVRQPFTSPFFYMRWDLDSLDPNVYMTRAYAPLPDRLRAYIRYARAVPGAVERILANLETPLPRTFLQIGRINYGGLAGYLEKDAAAVFAEVEDAALQAELKEANAAAIGALRRLDSWLGEQEASATDDFQLGAETFSEMLRRTEGVDVPLERVREMGEQDLEHNLALVRKACADYLPGASLQGCVAKAGANKPANVLEAAREQVTELRAFIVEKDLATIPSDEQAEVRESPPHMRWNLAFLESPGPYDSNLPSSYFISPPDPAWPKQEQIDYLPGETDLLFTSVHEVWPGHFLHGLHGKRAASMFGRVFRGYAFTEGWAHFAEEMMADAGLRGDTPEVRIGQLSNALLRNVRYLSAIGLHTGAMTVEESERMFVEKGLQSAATARQQAVRGTFDPAYLNYTLGKLMIRKLRDDWSAKHGGRESWKAFHDQILSFGGPPIPLVRRKMLDDSPAL